MKLKVFGFNLNCTVHCALFKIKMNKKKNLKQKNTYLYCRLNFVYMGSYCVLLICIIMCLRVNSIFKIIKTIIKANLPNKLLL